MLRIQTQVANSARHDETNVTVTQMVLSDRFKQRLRHLLASHGNMETNRTRRIPKTLQVLFEAKHAAIVKTNTLEDSIAVEQTMIEHRNFCVCFRIEFPVDVNFRLSDAGCRTGSTFYCRFNCFLSRTHVSLWFIQHRRISGFHVSNKTSNVYARNSNRKIADANGITAEFHPQCATVDCPVSRDEHHVLRRAVSYCDRARGSAVDP